MSSRSGGIPLNLVVGRCCSCLAKLGMWENSSSGELGVCWRKTRIHGNERERDPWGSWRELEKREWGKRRKNWDFFYSSRGSSESAGKRRKEIPPGIHQQEGIPALQPRVGGGSTSVWKTEENPAGVEETHGKSCRNGAGLFGKGKIWDERWHLPPVGPRLAKIHWLHPMEWE